MVQRHVSIVIVGAALGACLACGCADPHEPAVVELPVLVDDSGIEPMLTDLGYSVELTEARVVVQDVVFTVAGEAHAASEGPLPFLAQLLSAKAYAHPGHSQAGDVTGELPGLHVLNWLPGSTQQLGVATLLQGRYSSANFTFGRGSADGGTDAIHGHTAVLRGQAEREGATVVFFAAIDSPRDRRVTGVPFAVEIGPETTGRLGLRLLTVDPEEGDTLFDGIDFEALAQAVATEDGENGRVALVADAEQSVVADAYEQLRRTFQTHDHFDVQLMPAAD